MSACVHTTMTPTMIATIATAATLTATTTNPRRGRGPARPAGTGAYPGGTCAPPPGAKLGANAATCSGVNAVVALGGGSAWVASGTGPDGGCTTVPDAGAAGGAGGPGAGAAGGGAGEPGVGCAVVPGAGAPGGCATAPGKGAVGGGAAAPGTGGCVRYPPSGAPAVLGWSSGTRMAQRLPTKDRWSADDRRTCGAARPSARLVTTIPAHARPVAL